MRNSFVDTIKIKGFIDHTLEKDIDIPLHVSREDTSKDLPISVFLLEEIVYNTDKWINQEGYHYGWTIQSFATCLLWNIIACVGNEQDHIRHKDNIVLLYMSKAANRLENEKDSPLLPEDFVYIWQDFSEMEKKEIKNILIKSGKSFDNFPPLEKLNIIDTLTPVEVDYGLGELQSVIPLTVETSSGLSGVVPIYSSYPANIPASFNSVLSNDNTYYINNYHTWDLKNAKVRKNKNSIDDVVDYLSAIAQKNIN